MAPTGIRRADVVSQVSILEAAAKNLTQVNGADDRAICNEADKQAKQNPLDVIFVGSGQIVHLFSAETPSRDES
jgi:hypothetical protein